MEVTFLAVWCSDWPVVPWPPTRNATDCLGGSGSKVSVRRDIGGELSVWLHFTH
jgi:hypothetical protein